MICNDPELLGMLYSSKNDAIISSIATVVSSLSALTLFLSLSALITFIRNDLHVDNNNFVKNDSDDIGATGYGGRFKS